MSDITQEVLGCRLAGSVRPIFRCVLSFIFAKGYYCCAAQVL